MAAMGCAVTAVAEAAAVKPPPLKVTVGEEVYPEPKAVRRTLATEVAVSLGVRTAPLPAVQVMVTVGAPM